MIRAGLTVFAIFLGSQAAALSCVRPDPVRMYTQARDSTDTYIVVHGSLDLSGVAIPRRGYEEQQNQVLSFADIPMKGLSLSSRGFTNPFDRPITLRLSCVGPWCGGPPGEAPMIAFLQKTRQDYVLQIGPCGGWAYPTDDTAELQRIVDCHRRGKCKLRD